MGKLLRILVIVILVLGILALWLAVLNYSKREVVIGRTQKLEDAWVRIAATIETEDAEPVEEPGFPRRDVSPVQARVPDTVDTSPFWNTYNRHLEESGLPTFNLRTPEAQEQLQRFFAMDAEGRRVRDHRGAFRTTGEGTMQALIDQVLERSTQQFNNLNRTRSQLEALRSEHVLTIETLNREKHARRENLIRIQELDAVVARLEREKREDAARIERLEADKRELQLEIAEKNEDLNRRNEEIQNNLAVIERLNDEIRELRTRMTGRPEDPTVPPEIEHTLTAGEKGRIISVDPKWGFTITELSPAFMVELLGEDLDRPLPRIDMMVRRPGFEGPAGEFVTKIRLRQMIPEHNIVIADVLGSWQQAPLEAGDTVFY